MKMMNVIHCNGCGGCQLEMMTKQRHLADLFGLVDFKSNNFFDMDIGIMLGNFTKEELEKALIHHQVVLIGGACANESYIQLLEQNEIEKEANKGTIYQIKGCPISTNELIYTIHCLQEGIEPKQKNYAICKECKENENPCLIFEGKQCYGSVTQAGCNAKCTTMGIPCRGCRGRLPNANIELLKNVFSKFQKK